MHSVFGGQLFVMHVNNCVQIVEFPQGGEQNRYTY